MNVHGHCNVDRFGQVRTSQNRCEELFFLNRESHALQIWPTPKTCVQASNSTSLKTTTGGNSLSSRFNWHKVWTGVKCNFSWAHLHRRYGVEKLLISPAQVWHFTRIGPKTKKLWLSIIPALRRYYQPRLSQPQKRLELQLFLAALGQVIRCTKALDLGSLNM